MAERDTSSSQAQQANEKENTLNPTSDTFDAAVEAQQVAAEDVVEKESHADHTIHIVDKNGKQTVTQNNANSSEEDNPFEEVDFSEIAKDASEHSKQETANSEQPKQPEAKEKQNASEPQAQQQTVNANQSQEPSSEEKKEPEQAEVKQESQPPANFEQIHQEETKQEEVKQAESAEHQQPEAKPEKQEQAPSAPQNKQEQQSSQSVAQENTGQLNKEGEKIESQSKAPEAKASEEEPASHSKLNAVLDAILAMKPDPQQLKADVEAVLFITSKALQINEIAEIVEAPAEDVESAIGELIQDFAFREGSGLEIDDTDGYILQVREDCARIVHKMMPLEMSAATLRTLSAIAIKSPIVQSDLIELRGSTAYDHIAELLSKKLISKRRQGRSYVLNTTKAFDDYFKLNGDKRELETLVNRLKPEQKSQKENAETEAEPSSEVHSTQESA